MLGLPAGAAVVLEAGEVTAEVGALPDVARSAQSLLQIGVNLPDKVGFSEHSTRAGLFLHQHHLTQLSNLL